MLSNNIKIAPSILTADFANLADQIKIVEDAGADWLHLDIMDGHFVPNITFGPPVVEKIKKITKLPLDAHLMVENPDRFLDDFKNAGVDYLTIHIEVGYHLHRTIERIKNLGMKAGISLNPATPLSALEFLLPYVDMVLIMTVNPGFGGQKFIPQMLTKIEKVNEMIKKQDHEILLEVDGGIAEPTIPNVLNSGAKVLVIGSAIYNQPDIRGAVHKIRKLITKSL